MRDASHRPITLRAAPWLLASVLACGGEPVGAKVPRPNPTDVAIVAAAAAAATTLANPKAAGRKPEKNEQPEDLRDPKITGETVPSDVLDRADDEPADRDAGADDAGADQPAATPPDAGAWTSPFDFGQ